MPVGPGAWQIFFPVSFKGLSGCASRWLAEQDRGEADKSDATRPPAPITTSRSVIGGKPQLRPGA